MSSNKSKSTMPLSTRLQEFLWQNHTQHLFEVHPHVTRIDPKPYEDALECLGRGDGFWGVVPRVTPGNTKKDCVEKFDVLWVDIDKEPGVDPFVLLDAVKVLLPDEFHPSAVDFSGNKGLHCFWKLDGLLPIEEIEEWNKVLADVVGGDRNCYDATRILAHPGVPHRTTGRLVETIEFSAEIHPIERLELLPKPEMGVSTGRPKSPNRPLRVEDKDWFRAADALTCWGEPPEVELGKWLLGVDLAYMSRYWSKGWKRGSDTRSEVEMRIVHMLVGKGASDEQVIYVADRYFSKHRDEASYRYLERTIRSAREYWYLSGWLTHPSGGLRKKREAKYRWATIPQLENEVKLVRGQRVSEWISEVEGTGRSRASAYRDKKELVRYGIAKVKEGRIFPVATEGPPSTKQDDES